ncbi:uncharacterized protein LOC118478931 [Aplysia californica]|uniref:Uncharacterized protein LOC118478931 n=1 Tax=Aplysia californica TaxID=6500 RepID=A0ABM1W3U9_APLCA|nr:uncharacterized protein LOC118478931 [Aplysia californica]
MNGESIGKRKAATPSSSSVPSSTNLRKLSPPMSTPNINMAVDKGTLAWSGSLKSQLPSVLPRQARQVWCQDNSSSVTSAMLTAHLPSTLIKLEPFDILFHNLFLNPKWIYTNQGGFFGDKLKSIPISYAQLIVNDKKLRWFICNICLTYCNEVKIHVFIFVYLLHYSIMGYLLLTVCNVIYRGSGDSIFSWTHDNNPADRDHPATDVLTLTDLTTKDNADDKENETDSSDRAVLTQEMFFA